MKALQVLAVAAAAFLLVILVAPEVSEKTEKTQKAAPQTYRELVTVLPEDGQTWYLTLFLHRAGNAQSDALERAFRSNPRLSRAVTMTHFNIYRPGDRLYESRYRALIGGSADARLPCVLLQTSTGYIAYKASRSHVAADANVLADELARGVDMARGKNRLAPCCPEPDDNKGPFSPKRPRLVPDFRPRDLLRIRNRGTWLFLLIPAAAAAGAYFLLRNRGD